MLCGSSNKSNVHKKQFYSKLRIIALQSIVDDGEPYEQMEFHFEKVFIENGVNAETKVLKTFVCK